MFIYFSDKLINTEKVFIINYYFNENAKQWAIKLHFDDDQDYHAIQEFFDTPNERDERWLELQKILGIIRYV